MLHILFQCGTLDIALPQHNFKCARRIAQGSGGDQGIANGRIEFVRHAGHQLPERRQLFGTHQFRLRLLQVRQCRAELGRARGHARLQRFIERLDFHFGAQARSLVHHDCQHAGVAIVFNGLR